MNEEKGFAGSSIALAFILGGVLGAAFALLLAPESGSRTRERFKEAASGFKEKTRDVAEDFRGKVEEAIDRSKEALEEGKSIVTAAYQAGREAMQREKENLEARG